MADQINKQIQKVSLPPSWADKMIVELEKDKEQEAKDRAVFAQNLKSQIKELEDKLDTLLDTHLDGTITKEEYTAKKQKIINHKIEISEKLKDFERNGNHWLEPARQFISGSTSQNYRFARKSRRGTGFSQKDWLEPHFAFAKGGD